MKVQKAISIDTDVLETLMRECKREEISLSDYIMEAVVRIGPLTYDLAREIRPRNSMGIRREEFFSSRVTATTEGAASGTNESTPAAGAHSAD